MTSTDDQSRGRRAGHKATRAEQEIRLTEVHKLLLMQVPRHGILQYCANKTSWNLRARQIDTLISRATKAITTSAAFDRDLELGLAILQLKDLYGKAARIQDYKTCLAARRELSELLGLYSPKRVDLTDPEGKSPFIAIFPAPPSSREEWTRQCQQEQLERQRALASSGGQST